jgi:hypothetical protein
MTNTVTGSRIGAARVGIVLLALGTAGIHLYLFLIEGFLGNGKMLPIYQLLFVGNFLAYVISSPWPCSSPCWCGSAPSYACC